MERIGLSKVGEKGKSRVAMVGVASLRGRPRAQQQERKNNRDIFSS